MINNVYNSGPYVSVINSPGASPYINPSQPMTGLVRYVSNRLEVYDGSSWQQIGGGSASVSLTSDAIEILDWAKKRMAEEKQLEALAAKHPGVKDLKEKLDLMIKLVQEDNDRAVESA
jgi:hypothetical protein